MVIYSIDLCSIVFSAWCHVWEKKMKNEIEKSMDGCEWNANFMYGSWVVLSSIQHLSLYLHLQQNSWELFGFAEWARVLVENMCARTRGNNETEPKCIW